jgi:N-acylneuraminate cytidylyltransferase/CMP-N,N'-diacetyllegionaminic acid synthase
MKLLYLITARGGSKGLPGKNILPLHSKPLIAWSIEAAQQAQHKGQLVVSTDSEEIANVARSYGAEVPFIRPAALAIDSASSMDVIMHALDFYSANGENFDYVVLLQPTSPLRRVTDIDAALDFLAERKAEAVVSVCSAEHHPLWSNTLPPDGNMKDFIRPEVKGKNRQQLPSAYRINGAIFIASPTYLKEFNSFIADRTFAYEMPAEASVDIDSEIDFAFAELLLQRRKPK